MFNQHKVEAEIGGRTLRIETGKYARQANGSVMVTYGDTMVFVSAVASKDPLEGVDFMPLQVEYREKLSAAGKFPGGFIKREGRPSEKEVLSARLVDRPIRPLFPKKWRNETQIVAFVYSSDGENDSDVLAACGASAALHISDIPFSEPVANVRVGRINGEFIINPTFQQVAECDMELIVSGSENSIMMVEGEAEEVSEAELLDALKFAQEYITKIIGLQKELRELCGVEKREVVEETVDEALEAEVHKLADEKFREIVYSALSKEERSEKNRELKEEVLAALEEQFPEQEGAIKEVLSGIEKALMRTRILEEGIRLDGRTLTDVRPIEIELGVLPRTHGSALFTRGETQSLNMLTLGTKNDEQIVDGLQEEYSKRFILHYNFPPFSVGETGRMTGVGRREIGHGNLAERSLKKMVPADDEFPYTMRLISDILESNGSSSMATVCSGSLALMDGGVPFKKAVAGIAMGLVKEEDRYAVLTDILGNEDFLGDMDFKVAGTKDGITGFQMDIKIQGISFEIMEQALQQAKDGRMHILEIMDKAIAQPRENLSNFAPRLVSFKIDPEFIGAVIGPGGKVIQGLQREFEVQINIDDSGMVTIASVDAEGVEKCKEQIEGLVAVPEVGETYEGEVVKLLDFGALVEILPGKSGLLHISEIDTKRIDKVTDVFKEGDKVTVKLLKIDNGKYSLSRRVLLPDYDPSKSPPPGGGGRRSGGGDRGGDRRRHSGGGDRDRDRGRRRN